jgi:hypothetical protein
MEVDSATSAMSDAFEFYEDRISDYRTKLKYVDGACGLAVAIGGRLVSMDFFDKPSTCQQVWDRLLSGMVFDAIEAEERDTGASVTDVEQLIDAAAGLTWQPVDTVGEGTEHRAESSRGDQASALVMDNVIVHGNILVAV